MAYHPYFKHPFSLSRTTLARRWNVSVSTIKRVEARGDILPFTAGERSVRFRMEDVEAYEAGKLKHSRRGGSGSRAGERSTAADGSAHPDQG